MTPEMTMLALSVVLGFVYIMAGVMAVTSQYGTAWNVGPRDDPTPPLNKVASRLRRASRNFFETFPLFAAAVLIADATNRHSYLTVWGAQLYFWGRVVYLPLYALGIPVIRTIVWSVASIGIVMLLIALT
jgi:uncharacterized MAPEG superfamily protein